MLHDQGGQTFQLDLYNARGTEIYMSHDTWYISAGKKVLKKMPGISHGGMFRFKTVFASAVETLTNVSKCSSVCFHVSDTANSP